MHLIAKHLCLKAVTKLLKAGTLMSRAELERAAELTRRAGAWLVMDNTYGAH